MSGEIGMQMEIAGCNQRMSPPPAQLGGDECYLSCLEVCRCKEEVGYIHGYCDF